MSDIVERLERYAKVVMPHYPSDLCSDAKREIELLRRQVEQMRTALKPFAEVASEWDGESGSLEVELRAYDGEICPGVSVASFRAASRAVSSTQSEQDRPRDIETEHFHYDASTRTLRCK